MYAQVEHILLQDPEFPDEVSDMAADFVLNVRAALLIHGKLELAALLPFMLCLVSLLAVALAMAECVSRCGRI